MTAEETFEKYCIVETFTATQSIMVICAIEVYALEKVTRMKAELKVIESLLTQHTVATYAEAMDRIANLLKYQS